MLHQRRHTPAGIKASPIRWARARTVGVGRQSVRLNPKAYAIPPAVRTLRLVECLTQAGACVKYLTDSHWAAPVSGQPERYRATATVSRNRWFSVRVTLRNGQQSAPEFIPWRVVGKQLAGCFDGFARRCDNLPFRFPAPSELPRPDWVRLRTRPTRACPISSDANVTPLRQSAATTAQPAQYMSGNSS